MEPTTMEPTTEIETRDRCVITRARAIDLPFFSKEELGADASAVIVITVRELMRPERLVLEDDVAEFFAIYQLSLGNIPLLGTLPPIPGVAFRRSSTQLPEHRVGGWTYDELGERVRKGKPPVAQLGMQIYVGVTNVSKEPRTCRGAILGCGPDVRGDEIAALEARIAELRTAMEIDALRERAIELENELEQTKAKRLEAEKLRKRATVLEREVRAQR